MSVLPDGSSVMVAHVAAEEAATPAWAHGLNLPTELAVLLEEKLNGVVMHCPLCDHTVLTNLEVFIRHLLSFHRMSPKNLQELALDVERVIQPQGVNISTGEHHNIDEVSSSIQLEDSAWQDATPSQKSSVQGRIAAQIMQQGLKKLHKADVRAARELDTAVQSILEVESEMLAGGGAASTRFDIDADILDMYSPVTAKRKYVRRSRNSAEPAPKPKWSKPGPMRDDYVRWHWREEPIPIRPRFALPPPPAVEVEVVAPVLRQEVSDTGEVIFTRPAEVYLSVAGKPETADERYFGCALCPDCRFGERDRPTISNHVWIHLSKDEDIVLCMHCDYKSWRKFNVQRHLMEKHKIKDAELGADYIDNTRSLTAEFHAQYARCFPGVRWEDLKNPEPTKKYDRPPRKKDEAEQNGPKPKRKRAPPRYRRRFFPVQHEGLPQRSQAQEKKRQRKSAYKRCEMCKYDVKKTMLMDHVWEHVGLDRFRCLQEGCEFGSIFLEQLTNHYDACHAKDGYPLLYDAVECDYADFFNEVSANCFPDHGLRLEVDSECVVPEPSANIEVEIDDFGLG